MFFDDQFPPPPLVSPRAVALASNQLTYVPFKACVRCGTSLRYTKNRGCVKCNGDYSKKHFKRYSGRYRTRNNQWRKDHPEVQRNWHRLSEYNLTPEEYQSMLVEQDYCCAICGDPLDLTRETHVDHEGNKIRGILCGSCNRAIGLLKHATDILEKAIAYLKQPPCFLKMKN